MKKALLKEQYAVHNVDRTETFDDYFPCSRKKCKLKHVINWLNMFVDFHKKIGVK